jgi:hypothetical protein
MHGNWVVCEKDVRQKKDATVIPIIAGGVVQGAQNAGP